MRFLVAGDKIKGRSFFPPFGTVFSWNVADQLQQTECWTSRKTVTLGFFLPAAGTWKQLQLWEGPWKAGSWRLWLQDCGSLPCLSPVYYIVNLGPNLRIGGSSVFCMCVHECFHKRKKRGVVSCIRINGKCEGEGRENEKL